ncbi:agmatine deiminase [Pokkaliibacter sp. CJK22405]|uniref:agmatine deiminase n=1 Tax=Pokkaliibacter sp. CJK22405 TaxID=3384615 RepID=UPI003984B770
MKTLNSTPRADGFYMPAEWARQDQVWMLWPERTDNWRLGAKAVQKAHAAMAEAISRFVPVSIGVSAKQYENASTQLAHLDVRVVEISADDAWVRDTGPTFVINDKGDVRGVDWDFNCWGGFNGGLYFPWNRDQQVAHKVLSMEKVDRYSTPEFVLEGGSIHVDGEGTVLVTEECLLNSNRNPHMNREEIEAKLRDYLNIEQVIWLPWGLFNDETDGHVDNFCCFTQPGEVLLAWTDDQNDPNYSRCQQAMAVLESVVDAKGRKIKVHKVPVPGPLYSTEEECETIDQVADAHSRQSGHRLAGSYVNFLIVNGGIIAPKFDVETDEEARAILQSCFPDREIVMIPGREFLLGGGNIHCLTQQQPAG